MTYTGRMEGQYVFLLTNGVETRFEERHLSTRSVLPLNEIQRGCTYVITGPFSDNAYCIDRRV